jgi:predicted ATPase/class 3 adenylate cyclase
VITDTHSGALALLFTDIEGSTQLWETEPGRMRTALARHDALVRATIEDCRGAVVKMTGDGVYAVFEGPRDAIDAALELQLALARPNAIDGVSLQVRCGLHVGVVERRDDDFFGAAVNRTARIMGAAHGGQVLLSHVMAELVRDHLPDEVSLRALGAVRLRDLASPELVSQLVHPELRQDFPALRSLESTPNNLPQQVSSFVGRERELADVRKMLANTRLLTLLGPGGLGKTRLSLHAAADAMDEHPDGVWFVELASLAEESLVPQTVASVLGVKEDSGRPVVDALTRHVNGRQLLVILDNCEHLVGACADLAKTLLEAAPRVKILASSREQLRVTGETCYPLSPLSQPQTPAATVEELTEYESVRLFAERATAAQPSFRLSADNAAAVVEICRQLDGIPLALELAAARVGSLAVEKIAARLSDRFRLLTGGDRTRLPRQQTLRASIDWSYDLLDAGERATLRRLALFVGGWTLEAAEAVCAGGEVSEGDVLDLLSRLVEKSLVVLEPGGARYRMLETVRQYARELLVDPREETEGRIRHLRYYVALARELGPQLTGADQARCCALLHADRENIVAAHAWCERAPDGASLGLGLLTPLPNYWLMRGRLQEGYRVTTEALARPDARERTPERARALHAAGQIAYFMGRYREAREHLTESLAIDSEASSPPKIDSTRALLGHVALALGEPAVAREHYTASLAIGRERGDKFRIANALTALAEVYFMEGELDRAEPLYEETLAIDRERGDGDGMAGSLVNLAAVSVRTGRGRRAQEMLREALAIAERIESRRAGILVLGAVIGLAALRGDWSRAARLEGATQALDREMGMHREPTEEVYLAPFLARTREALGVAAFDAAVASGGSQTYERAMDETRAWLDADADQRPS